MAAAPAGPAGCPNKVQVREATLKIPSARSHGNVFFLSDMSIKLCEVPTLSCASFAMTARRPLIERV